MKTKKLNSATRAQEILDLLARHPEVGVIELTERFRVTAMTIRRDLDALERAGKITRTHGGAILTAPSVVAFEFNERRQTNLREKEALARAAAQWVEPGMTVILDTGTTTLAVAHALAGLRKLKVLTSSLAIASALYAREGLELVLLGGQVSKNSPDLSGPLTEDNLRAFRAELAFVGADALDAGGLYTSSQEIARVSRAILASAKQTVLVADSSKLGRTSFARFADWEMIDRVVMDDGLATHDLKWLKKAVAHVNLVPVERSEA
jgi:DeoR/GlpR family transcriptional regulator of sugar metabolism